jgi:O-antigen ligase
VVIRRQTQDGIVNIWLILIVIVGTLITIADGLTRVSIFDREEAWNGPLQYESYLGAFLFAGTTFALMVAYARKARISLSEGLFLWFVLCTAAYTRDFSYVRWPGTPLFITDVVLLILVLSISLLQRPRHSRFPLPVNVLLALFLGAGALSAARGFLGHREAMVVLRDSALVVYALFLLVGYHLFRSWLSIKRVAVWLLLGAVLGALNGLAWFIAVPEERRFIYFGIYILISLVGTVVAMASRLLRPRVGWIFAGVLCLGLMLANARSLFVSLAILLLVGLLGGWLAYKKIRLAYLISIFVTAVVMVSLAASIFLRTGAGSDFAERSAGELASGVFNTAEDPNWQFRLSAWKEAWKRFEEYPLAGEGFGVPFTFQGSPFDNDPRPHNTYLTVLYKMGLTGFLPLLALLVYFFWSTTGAVHSNLGSRRVPLLQIVVLAQIAFLLYGAANLLLESPFLAALFWAALGLGLRIVRILNLERSLRRGAYAH